MTDGEVIPGFSPDSCTGRRGLEFEEEGGGVKPKGIVFDMYGTVADLNAVTEACRDLVENPETFGSLWRRKQLEYTFLLTLMEEYRDFWQVTDSALDFTVATLGVHLEPPEKKQLMDSWLSPRPYDDAYQGLQQMKGRYPLTILSNGSPGMLREGLKYAGLDGFFDKVLSVEEARAFKPSPKVYELAPTHLGLTREEIFFVSSNSFDVVGARKFGFLTCWLRRTGKPLDSLGEVPDYVVGGFEELAFLTAEVS